MRRKVPRPGPVSLAAVLKSLYPASVVREAAYRPSFFRNCQHGVLADSCEEPQCVVDQVHQL